VQNVWNSPPKAFDFNSLLSFKRTIRRVDFRVFSSAFSVSSVLVLVCNFGFLFTVSYTMY